MPWATREKHRAYQHRYNATEREKDKRAMRNAARREAIREHGKEALKGKDVDHKRSLDSGGSNADSNLRIMDRGKNRGFERDRNNQPKR